MLNWKKFNHPFSRRSSAHQRPVAAVSRQGFSTPKIDWYDQSITHETNPRGTPPPPSCILSRDAQYAGVLRTQILSYCPLRGMQQRAS